MSGLARICKMYGGMKVNGVMYVWDYANDTAVPKSEMPAGSERHRTSEKAKWEQIAAQNKPEPTP